MSFTQNIYSSQYSIYRAPCCNFAYYGKCAYHLKINPLLEDGAAIEILDQAKTLSSLDLVVLLSNTEAPIEEVLHQKKFIKILIDGLNLLKKQVLIEVSGTYHYGYLKNSNIIWDVFPIRKEKEYRIKQYRNLIVNKYINDNSKVQFRFMSATNKDDERIDSFFAGLPSKSLQRIQKQYIPILIKSTEPERTNLFISDKNNTLWSLQSQCQIF